MYEAYYHLDRPPFSGSVPVDSLYAASSQQDAIGRMRYAIERHLPFAILAGGPGVGKTTVARRLLSQLDELASPRAFLTYPLLKPTELLAFLLAEWFDEVATDPNGRPDLMIRALRDHLVKNAERNQQAVLMIDDAHLIESQSPAPHQFWETLRLIGGIGGPGSEAVTCLLIGRTELVPSLRGGEALADQLDAVSVLTPFDVAETGAYVSHRLRIAGSKRTLFQADALEAIHHWTGGLPRRIDRLADLALLVGYAEERITLDAAHIAAVAEDTEPSLPGTSSY